RRHTSKCGAQENATDQHDNRERFTATLRLPSCNRVSDIDVQHVECHGVHPFVHLEAVFCYASAEPVRPCGSAPLSSLPWVVCDQYVCMSVKVNNVSTPPKSRVNLPDWSP